MDNAIDFPCHLPLKHKMDFAISKAQRIIYFKRKQLHGF